MNTGEIQSPPRVNKMFKKKKKKKILLIEFEICLYKHQYFLYIRNALFLNAVFVYMLWQLKVNMFYQKIVFQLYKRTKSAITFDRGACSTHCLQY